MQIKKLSYLLFILFSLCFQQKIAGQVERIEYDDIPVPVEKPNKDKVFPVGLLTKWPRFKSCKKLSNNELKDCFRNYLNKYITRKLDYPQNYRIKDSLAIAVTVSFKIDKNGDVFDIKSYSKSDESDIKKVTEKKAFKIIKKLPKLEPGELKGNKVMSKYAVKMYFPIKNL